jgi:uncharacterized membrane protein
MSLGSSFFDNGPAEALAAMARHLQVACDEDDLRARFASHTTPTSLKALVEIAPEFGLTARAFKSDLVGLQDARLPAVVHVVDGDGERGGFALLVRRESGRVWLHDGLAGEPVVVEDKLFARTWTGVLVTIEPGRGHTPAAQRAGLRLRLAAWWRREDPLARAALVARGAALALVAVGALAGAARFGAERAGAAGAALGLLVATSWAGAWGAGLALFFSGRRTLVPGARPRLATSFCGRGPSSDCTGVLASRYSRFAGIDWASLGIAFYSAALLVGATSALVGAAARAAVFGWLAVAFGAALPVALVFVGLQVWPLRRFCPLCMATHAVTLIGTLSLSAAFAWGAGASPSVAALAPAALGYALAFLAAFGLVIPFLSLGLESHSNRTRLGWIAATPFGALAESAGRPRAARELPAAPLNVAAGPAPFRLDALVHPMCSGCAPVVRQLVTLAERHPAQVTIGLHLAPRDPGNPADAELCAGLAAAGLLAGPGRGAAVFLASKDNPWRLLTRAQAGGARAVIDAVWPDASADAATLTAAHDAVRAADALGARLERGTPTLLINGWLWDGSLDDFDKLLTREPELLASVLRARLPRPSLASAS